MGALLLDVKLVCRQVRRTPGRVLAIVLPLLLGIAMVTAIFSVTDGLLFRPLAFRDASRLVAVSVNPSSDVAYRDVMRYRQIIVTLPKLPGLSGVGFASLSATGDAENAVGDVILRTAAVSPGLFELLGVSPVLGRDLSDQDGPLAVGPAPVVIGFDLWQQLFAGDMKIAGSIRQLGDRQVRILGVMPKGMDFPDGANVWTPSEPMVSGAVLRLWNVARLQAGASIAQVQGLVPELRFESLRQSVRPEGAESVILLLVVTAAFLVMVWIQVGGLMLHRATERAAEVGIRLALGASRWRLVRQFAIESSVLGLVALAGAWMVVPGLVMFVQAQLPSEMTLGQALEPDWRAFGFAALVAVIGAGLLGAAPTNLLASMNAASLLGSGRALLGIRTSRIRSALLVAQIGFTAMLLCVAGLALRSFVNVNQVDPGFNPEGLWRFRLPAIPESATGAQRRAAQQERTARLQETARAVAGAPGVLSVAATTGPPLDPLIRGRVSPTTGSLEQPLDVRVNLVSETFFQTMGMPLQSGDGFSAGDRRMMAVINETLARRLAGSAPLGLEIEVLGSSATIVGVVEDFIDSAPNVPSDAHVFLPLRRPTASYLLVRTRGSRELPPEVRAIIDARWGPGAATRMQPLEEDIAAMARPWRSRFLLLNLIAAFCLPLALAGVAGAVVYAVQVRLWEIGVRLALGADISRLWRGFATRAVGQLITGTGIGLMLGGLIGRWAQSHWFGIQALDPVALGSAGTVMIASGSLVIVLALRPLSQMSPATVLRERPL